MVVGAIVAAMVCWTILLDALVITLDELSIEIFINMVVQNLIQNVHFLLDMFGKG